MSSTSRNKLARGLPLFLGITSPLSVQGEITVNVNVDPNEVLTRRANMNHDISRNKSYPFNDLEEIHILQGEAVFGWVDHQGRTRIPGNPSQVGFSAMGGIKYGRTANDEELAARIKFIGIAKANYKFDDPSQLKHGFSCLAAGSTTTFNSGITDFQAGDVIEWNVVPRPVVPSSGGAAIMSGGQYGDNGPGTRQGHPAYGTPHGKLRFRLNVSRFNDVTPSLNHAVSCMRRTQQQGGISDRPIEHLFAEGSLGLNTPRLTAAQEFAMALLTSSMVTAVRVLEIFEQKKNRLPTGYLDLADQMGLFQDLSKPEDQPKKDFREDIICGLFMVPGAGPKGKQAMDLFINNHARGFKQNTRVLLRDPRNWDASYARVATQLGRFTEIAYARAVHLVARRRIGFTLAPSSKGGELDVCVGHRRETW
jgi:hypothetical protein